jgi:hypothetical protein
MGNFLGPVESELTGHDETLARFGEASAAGPSGEPTGYLSLLFSSSNQPAASASGPPSSLGAASKPRRKNSVKARSVTGFLALIPAGGKGALRGKPQVSPVRMGAA